MSSITVEHKGLVAVITLHRPPVNSLVEQTYREIQEAFQSVSALEGVRVAVFRAEGKHFSTGNDVAEFLRIQTPEQARDYTQVVSDGISAVYQCEIPVVAAVQGHAMGAGMALAACADVVIASEETVFGIPEIKVGVIGAYGFLALLVPEKVARYLSISGNSIPARQVMQYGGVHSIVPRADVTARAIEVAQELSVNTPTGVRLFKRAINANHDAKLVEQYAVEAACTGEFVGSAEAREAVAAFLEKREPSFD